MLFNLQELQSLYRDREFIMGIEKRNSHFVFDFSLRHYARDIAQKPYAIMNREAEFHRFSFALKEFFFPAAFNDRGYFFPRMRAFYK